MDREIMTRIWALAVCMIALALINSSAADAGAGAAESRLEKAFSAWENGDIPEAYRLAAPHSDIDAGRHLLLLCAVVQGQYEQALELYPEIDPSYPRYEELNLPVAMSYLHSGRYQEARSFAEEHRIHDVLEDRHQMYLNMFTVMAEHPLSVSLDKITTIPFQRNIATKVFPPFRAYINGRKITAHLDTGGSFLHMGIKGAKKLGIEPLLCSRIFANTGRGRKDTELCWGIAESFQIGDALLANVPVAIGMISVDVPYNYAIFGTSVFQQFLTTMDYQKKKLILSPRNNKELREKHLGLLPPKTVEMPFYLWTTHWMFAKGGVGDDRNLNLFIDSGLVTFRWDHRYRFRQAGFIAPEEKFVEWGGEPDPDSVNEFIEAPCSLGPLEQENCIVTLERPNLTLIEDFGGVRIDGLVSHAFLRNYSWTLDFDEHRYIFSE